MTSKFTISGGSRQGVDYLTIVGARQSGKTEMMLRHGLAEANLGRSVYYEGQSRVVTTESFRRAIALADNYDSVEKIRRAHGNESILFDNGGRILFGVDEARGFTFDTHLIDGANSEPHITASRVIRSALR